MKKHLQMDKSEVILHILEYLWISMIIPATTAEVYAAYFVLAPHHIIHSEHTQFFSAFTLVSFHQLKKWGGQEIVISLRESAFLGKRLWLLAT